MHIHFFCPISLLNIFYYAYPGLYKKTLQAGLNTVKCLSLSMGFNGLFK